MFRRIENRGRLITQALIFLVLMCVGLIWVAAGPLMPSMMQYYNAGRGMVSWSVSIVPIVMSAFAVPAGLITARVGAKRVFATGAFLQAAGLMTPVCSSFPLLVLTRMLFAIGAAMTFPVAGGIVAEWFNSKELPVVNGLNMSSTSIGNAVAFFATVPIATLSSWRMPLVLYGALSFIFASLWVLLGKEKTGVKGATPSGSPVKPVTVAPVLRQRATLLLAGSLVGPFCLFMAVSSWLPTYYSEVFHMPLARASAITAILTLTGIPACILGGLIPSWVGLRKPFLLIPGLLMVFSGLGCFLFNNPAIFLPSIALFGVCNLIFMPTVFTIPMELPGMTPRSGAVVLALAIAVGNVGGFLGPLIVGYLRDITGSYVPGFVICSILSLSLFFGGLLLPETGPRKREG